MPKAPRGSRKVVAQALNVSDRTLRSWQASHGSIKKRGRKPASATLSEVKLIVAQWKEQGEPGTRPVIQALPKLRVRLIRDVIGKFKAKRLKRANELRLRARIAIDTNEPGTVLAMDGATVQKGEDIVVVRDRGSLRLTVVECGRSLCSADTLMMLQNMQQEGRLPVVLCTDNGSPFCSNVVEDYLAQQQVIHLKSLPHVPQHNGSAECAVKEVKTLLKMGINLFDIVDTLNERRKRRRLNWKTAAEFDSENFIPYTIEKRQQFYSAAKLAIKEAMLGTKNGYERRKAEREAILITMERFRLVTITRGGQTCL